MTSRGVGLLLGGALLVGLGWGLRWPEATGLGTAAIVLVLAVLMVAGTAPQARLEVPLATLRVARDQPAQVEAVVDLRTRRRWVRLVEGAPRLPHRSVGIPERRADSLVRIPLDTSRRGQWLVGPFTLVHADPLGLVRHDLAESRGGTLTVHPRVHAVTRSVLRSPVAGESDSSSRRQGEEHFHALRDYVMGDEPRTVHWRSSARAGKLVVRQQLSAATTGTTLVLDVDKAAYGTGERFSGGWDAERFELAVEVLASLALHQGASIEKVHVVTTRSGGRVTSANAGAAAALLDALAVVQALPPVETSAGELPALVRRTKCARVLVVSGDPSPTTVTAVRALVRAVPSTLLVRVGEDLAAAPAGLRVLDLRSPADLV